MQGLNLESNDVQTIFRLVESVHLQRMQCEISNLKATEQRIDHKLEETQRSISEINNVF